MNLFDGILYALCTISIAACMLLCREFIRVSSKREQFLNLFTEDSQGTKRSAPILIGIYVVVTLLCTMTGLYFGL